MTRETICSGCELSSKKEFCGWNYDYDDMRPPNCIMRDTSSLIICGWHTVPIKNLLKLMRHCKKLKEICVTANLEKFSFLTLSNISHSLTILNIPHFHFEDDADVFKNLHHLEELHVKSSNSKLLIVLSKLTRLSNLNISESQLDWSVIQNRDAPFPSLKILNCQGPYSSRDDFQPLNNNDLFHVAKITTLKNLNISSNPISSVNPLIRLTNLEELYMIDTCMRVESLNVLICLEKLNEICLEEDGWSHDEILTLKFKIRINAILKTFLPWDIISMSLSYFRFTYESREFDCSPFEDDDFNDN